MHAPCSNTPHEGLNQLGGSAAASLPTLASQPGRKLSQRTQAVPKPHILQVVKLISTSWTAQSAVKQPASHRHTRQSTSGWCHTRNRAMLSPNPHACAHNRLRTPTASRPLTTCSQLSSTPMRAHTQTMAPLPAVPASVAPSQPNTEAACIANTPSTRKCEGSFPQNDKLRQLC